jgi:hypothetical protein
MPTKSSWRDVLSIHPAANLFPRMSEAELAALATDIKVEGLKTPVTLWSPGYSGDGVKDRPRYVLDGRNRLDAMERAGIQVITDKGELTDRYGVFDHKFEKWISIGDSKRLRKDERVEPRPGCDPYAFVVSANLHRLHLTAEQKRDLLAKMIKAEPEKSDRTIAAMIKASHHTVGAVRTEMETRGQIAHVETRTDTKGRQQPAKKARPTSASRKPNTTKAPAPPTKEARDDIGESSTAEAARLQARIEELQAEKRQLEIKLKGYESEVEELRAGRLPSGLAEKLDPLLETLFEQGRKNQVTMSVFAVMIAVTKLERLLIEHGIMPPSRRSEDPQGYIRLLQQRAARRRDKENPPPATAPPDDDGLDIPASLRRTAP